MTLLVNPTPRYSASAAADGSGNVILFGGKTTANTSTPGFCGDSYKFASGAWTKITGTLPPYRAEAPCFYDGTSINIICGANENVNLSDQWQWTSGSNWSKVSLPAETIPYPQPTTLRAASATYMSSDTSAFLFGGSTPYNRAYTIDTWSWQNPATWTLLPQTVSPPAVEYSSMASNGLKNVLFGGKNFSGGNSFTYTFNGTIWANVSSGIPGINCPSPRYGASMTYDSSGVFVLFGGITANGYSNETWQYTIGTNTWVNVSPTISPPPMGFNNLVFSSASSSSLLFGGKDNQQVFGQTWIYTSGVNTWVKQ